jgi:hypothetical protein
VAISAYEDVFWFEVTIDNARCMKPFDAFNNFSSVESGSITT